MDTAPFQSDSDANGSRAQGVEELGLRILEMPAVKEAVAKALQLWQESDVAERPGARRSARSAANEIATLASMYCAMGTVPEPTFVWVQSAPRNWHGYSLPGSRWYADNVDTQYRGLRVDEDASYVVTIKPGERLAAQLSFMIWDWILYENGARTDSDVPMGTFIVTEETPRNPDGTITLTMDPEPANGRTNHLQLKPGARQLWSREIKDDWSVPSARLSVERVGGPAPKVKDLEELAQEAAIYILAGAAATLQIEVVVGNIKENELNPLMVRWLQVEEGQKMVTDEVLGPDRALGFLSSGLFNLEEDEALIMTLNMLGTKYLSVNTYRPFLVSPEHVYGTSSLNNYQSKANPDGSISFVLARKDPGVYNWLDVGGIPFGEIAVRWQTLTHPVSGTLKTAAQMVKVVKLADLRQELPPTTKWVTAEERAAQRAARAELFKIRCLGTPCEVGGELDKMY